jgi:hypothetical protein
MMLSFAEALEIEKRARFDEKKHPRWPKGTPRGLAGKFKPKDVGETIMQNAILRRPALDALEVPGVRAWSGGTTKTRSNPSKLLTDHIASHVAINVMAQHFQDKSAVLMHARTSQFPIDMFARGRLWAVEIKAGLVSNTRGAQQWRVTQGEASGAEKAWRKTASASAKAKHGKRMVKAALARKEATVSRIESEIGRPIKRKTMTVIVHPDKKLADVFLFDGYHARIGWNDTSLNVGKAYVGTFSYRVRAR